MKCLEPTDFGVAELGGCGVGGGGGRRSLRDLLSSD